MELRLEVWRPLGQIDFVLLEVPMCYKNFYRQDWQHPVTHRHRINVSFFLTLVCTTEVKLVIQLRTNFPGKEFGCLGARHSVRGTCGLPRQRLYPIDGLFKAPCTFCQFQNTSP